MYLLELENYESFQVAPGEKLHRGNLLNVKGCKELREVNVESDSKWKENSTRGKV